MLDGPYSVQLKLACMMQVIFFWTKSVNNFCHKICILWQLMQRLCPLTQVYFGTQHAKMYLSADLFGINCVTGMSCLFRKDILEGAGGFTYLGKYLAEDYYLGKVFLDK